MKFYLKVSCVLLATGMLAACDSTTKPTAQPSGKAVTQTQEQEIQERRSKASRPRHSGYREGPPHANGP